MGWGIAALYASAVAAAAVTFRSWDVRSGAEVERWDVYVAPALVFWATWPVGWRWYGRRSLDPHSPLTSVRGCE